MADLKHWVFASSNEGKIREMQAMLAAHSITLTKQSELGIEDAEETGTTFIENALIKAENAAKYTTLPVISDDSGLVIDALDGEPGIYSARYAGANRNFQANIDKIQNKLSTLGYKHPVSAYYVCALALITPNTTPITVEAQWHGSIISQGKGTLGFGYDPIFFLADYQCTVAQLPSAIKHSISHRAKAIEKLMAQC